jgi:hypothetical protein
MRSLGLGVLFVGLAACAEAPARARVTTPPAPLQAPASVEAPPRGISLGELGAGGVSAEWIELEMPPDARVLGFARDVPEGRETWTLLEAGGRRVLRVRLEDGKRVGQAAWVGTVQKDAIELRLVEVRGKVRFAPERLSANCRTDKVCEDGKPARRAGVSMCTFASSEAGVAEVAFLAPGKGIDFAVGSCPYVEPLGARRLRGPRSTMHPGF